MLYLHKFTFLLNYFIINFMLLSSITGKLISTVYKLKLVYFVLPSGPSSLSVNFTNELIELSLCLLWFNRCNSFIRILEERYSNVILVSATKGRRDITVTSVGTGTEKFNIVSNDHGRT